MPAESYLKLDNYGLRVLDEGVPAAPCVIFSHSIMTDAGMWRPQVDALKDRFRVIRYDARGHGGSSTGEGPYSIASLASDVVRIMDALDIEKAHFVGLSLGGIVGYDLGVNHAHRLHSLVICDARADSPQAFARPWDERIETALSEGMEPLVEPTVSRWFGAGFLESDQATAVRQMIRQTPVAGFVATARALQKYDYLSQVPSISVPTTYLVGENDGVLPEVMQSLSGQTRASRYVVVPAAGHLPNLENPTSFNAALEEHFGLCEK